MNLFQENTILPVNTRCFQLLCLKQVFPDKTPTLPETGCPVETEDAMTLKGHWRRQPLLTQPLVFVNPL